MIDRRQMLIAGMAGAAVAALPAALLAQDAPAKSAEELIAAFTGGAEPAEGDGVALNAPEIAENGNTVPVDVDAPGATEIMVLASGNPSPEVITAKFGPLAGSQKVATRIRLAKTQDVVAIAKFADGSFQKAAANVKVTIGGCGG